MPAHSDKASRKQFSCRQCGALQTFAPGTRSLRCQYCGHENVIGGSDEQIREYDFRRALAELEAAPAAEERITTQCGNCAAEFGLEEHTHAGECPFCGTAVVTGTGRLRHIKPKSLLPFLIDDDDARGRFRAWLQGLWFAPGAVKRHARDDSPLVGVYVPYWTYDSQTHTRYSGERGDAYTVRVPYTTIVKGKTVQRVRREIRIRWTPVSGAVSRFFDDVLVGASNSLPRKITDRLAPWDLENLQSYDEKYLSGFRSEVYQVGLEQGFDRAVQIMDGVILDDIARDIGGDRQRVTHTETRHSETTFKHLLLPVWSAAFRFKDRSYRFVVNARTGRVQGERPYSVVKIAFASIVGVAVAVGILVLLQKLGILEQLLAI